MGKFRHSLVLQYPSPEIYSVFLKKQKQNRNNLRIKMCEFAPVFGNLVLTITATEALLSTNYTTLKEVRCTKITPFI